MTTRETISSYLRRPCHDFRVNYKSDPNQTKSAAGHYQWEDIKAVKAWDAFNQSPVQPKFRRLLYEDQHENLTQPCIPIANTIISSEQHLQTSLHLGLLAKVNLALEAITKISQEKQDDMDNSRRIMDLGVLNGRRVISAIPDLAVQNISVLGWKKQRLDEDEDDVNTNKEREQSIDDDDDIASMAQKKDKEGEEIHSPDFGQHSRMQESNSDIDKDKISVDRQLTSGEERINTLGPEKQEKVDDPPMLLAGDIKLYSGWKHSMWEYADSRGIIFRQVLSQVNFYLIEGGCHYGFVVTEREFVAVYRPGRKGLLKVSQSFPILTGKEGLGQGDGDGTYPSSPGNLCADEALLALILWAADPPLPGTDPEDETGDSEAEEDEYYPIIETEDSPSVKLTSSEKGSVFVPSNSHSQSSSSSSSNRLSSSPSLPDRKRTRIL